MDNQNNGGEKVWLFQKIINYLLIFLWIIFFIRWLVILLAWVYIYWFSLLIVWISFFPYTYNKIKNFLVWKKFAKKIVNNYWEIYFFIFFAILNIWVISSYCQIERIREDSNLSVSYSINEKVTNRENITLVLTQKYLDKIIINNQNIDFDNNQEVINKVIPLNIWKNEIIIRWENRFYQKDFSKTITRLSEDEYKSYLIRLEEEKIKKEK